MRGTSRRMFEGSKKRENLVRSLRIEFAIGTKQIRGYVALLMDIESIGELRSRVAELVTRVAAQPGPV